MQTNIPVMIVIDVEPDGRMIPHDQTLPWKGYEGCFEYFSKMRDLLNRVTGQPVNFGWYYRVDPQVEEVYGDPAWALTHYKPILDSLMTAGDDIGLHPHAYRWVDDRKGWVVDHGDQAWVNHCVRMSFKYYEKVLGRGCESFRFGERWMNTETMNLVRELGARYDLTLEPFHPSILSILPEEAEAHTGMLPNGQRFLRTPYRPSEANFTVADQDGSDEFLVVPMSSGYYSYEFGFKEKVLKFINRDGDLKPQPFTLNFNIHPKIFRHVIDECLELSDSPYLLLSVRSDVCSDIKRMARMDENFEILMSHPMGKQFSFTGVNKAMNSLGYKSSFEVSGGKQ